MVVAASVVASTLSVGAHAPAAAADPLANKRAQAAALAQQIQTLGQQEDALSERFDQATINLQSAQQQVTQANKQLSTDQQAESSARRALTNEAVNAYVNGGDEQTAATLNAQPLSNINENVIRSEYLGDLTSDQSDTVDQYHLAVLKTSDDRTQLQSALTAAQKQAATLSSDRQAVQASAAQMQATLNSVNGQIATLVAQAQAAQEAAAAKAAQERLAQQQAQQRQAALAAAEERNAAAQQASSGLASTSGSGASTPSSSSGSGTAPSAPVVATGSLQARAVSYALSRVGDPYVWGAAGPSTFDCSGLVMWSYAQAGYSLPHFSGSQYDDTIHIPLADVEPGDLVFPADPGEHVAMYIGGGNIVQAPYTGADVQVVPLSNFFVYASRVP